MKADGSEKTNVVSTGGSEFAPAWSPDGSAIVFAAAGPKDADIYVTDTNGTRVTNLTNEPSAWDSMPAWSPDGTTIVFSSNRATGFHNLYVMDATGSNVRQITFPATPGGVPAWSPDGRHILFTSFADGDADLWMVDPDGSNLGHLTDSLGNEQWGEWESVNRLPSATTTVRTTSPRAARFTEQRC